MTKTKNLFNPNNYKVDYAGARIPTNEIETSILIFDIVGFSKNATNNSMIKTVNEIHDCINNILVDKHTWGEDAMHQDADENDLLLLPMGDGYGIVLGKKYNEIYILEIARLLYAELIKKNIVFRMGIAKGNSIVTFDMNGNVNIFGFGIVLTTRVCNAAKDGQILIHSTLAESILQRTQVTALQKIETEFVAKHEMKFYCHNYFEENNFGISS